MRSHKNLRYLSGLYGPGNSDDCPPVKLDAAIIFASAGDLIPKALAVTDKGGTIICGGIHMSDIPSFSYHLLWEERLIRSVANLTRADAKEFFDLLKGVPVHTTVQTFALNEANEALNRLRDGNINGAAVLVMH